MPRKRLLVLLAAVAAIFAVPAGSAHAALTCAPDQYEVDTSLSAAPITPGQTLTRAICQEPLPFPRTTAGRDEDWFAFEAPGGKAYTVEAVNVGSGLANDAFNNGGLQLGFARLNDNGSTTAIEENRLPNGDRSITGPLPAGRYAIIAMTNDTQIYQPANVMDIRTVQGDAGIYSVRLTENAAGVTAPVVTSLRLSTSVVKGGQSLTGTYTLSAPAPPGGMYVDIASSHVYNATPGYAYAPGGATRVSFPIRTRASSTDLRVTLTAWARVGPRVSATLTVRR